MKTRAMGKKRLTPKFLVIGIDGFRPDLLDAELTPNLWAFAQDAVQYTDHRAVFPSDTYPNIASLLSGVTPGQHGIVANKFFANGPSTKQLWSGADLSLVEAANHANQGGFQAAPLLGELLGKNKKVFWVISTNSAGSARLKHPTAERYPGHLCIIVKAIDNSHPLGIGKTIQDLLGPVPALLEKGRNVAHEAYATDTFVALEGRFGMPDVALLWYGETDQALHVFGLGVKQARDTIARVDVEIGRVLHWWRHHPEHDRIQIVIVSDHGHITQTRKIKVKSILAEAGFKVGRFLDKNNDLALIPGHMGSIIIRNGDPELLRLVTQAMMGHKAMGMLFTPDRNEIEGIVPGTFAQSLAGIYYRGRSSDLVFSLRDCRELDPFGFAGTCWADNGFPVGVSTHGGFHPNAIKALLILGGSLFQPGREIHSPSGIMDLAPTILHCLGADAGKMAGRILTEAWSGPEIDQSIPKQRWTVGHGEYEQELDADHYAGARYLGPGRRIS